MASWSLFGKRRTEANIAAIAATPLPEYGYRYFEHVLAEYLMNVPSDSSPPGRITECITKYRTNRPVTWADLYVLEKHILRSQPLTLLRRRAWGLRANFREIVGLRAYEGYLASRPPSENDEEVKEEAIRADLERLLGALHWNYSLAPIRERLRSQTIKMSGWLIVLAFVGLTLMWHLFEAKAKPLVATMLLVAFSGAVGGFVSLQRRIQSIPTDGDPLISIFDLENGRITLLLAPMSGAIFALFLYFAFLGELLAGGVFPKITPIKYSPLPVPLEWTAEFAKLLVWSFIAGFAERFVPDTISRLVDRGRDASTPTTTAQSPTPPYGPSSPPTQGTGQREGGVVNWRGGPQATSPPWR